MSPYLQQHSTNPVDWYPWGEEAFQKAKKENKLLFVSVGYSTCHWCHVMERESFSVPEVGELMNSIFVCIKVDREERPDVDSYFIDFAQRTTGSAGWPLNIILTPELKPAFAFTYLPRESRNGNMGLVELITSIGDIWKNDPQNIISTARQNEKGGSSKKLLTIQGASMESVETAFRQLSRMYDPEYGGFGRGIKFPTPHNLSFLASYYKKYGNKDALEMSERTVAAIRMGGIYDHVGKGIHRYATDTGWKIPHFEKMLYDQASFINGLSSLFEVTGKKVYDEMIMEIVSFLRENMKSGDGAFYTAIDADSEGIEGKFYTWSSVELKNILREDYENFAIRFNISEDGNYIEEPRGLSNGRNILYLDNGRKSTDKFIEHGLFWLSRDIKDSLETLRERRMARKHPQTDMKICADINGFLLYALSRAYMATGREDYRDEIKSLYKYITENLMDSNKILHLKYENGRKIDGFLSDYVFISLGLLAYSMVFPENSNAKIVEQIMNEANENIIREMEQLKREGFAKFTGNIQSQEDSAFPSQFSAYERVLSILKFYGIFLPFNVPATEEGQKNMREYPAYFTFRTENYLMEENTFSIKGEDMDGEKARVFRNALRKMGYRGSIIFIKEGSEKGKYSLCNSKSCLMENVQFEELAERLLKETKN